MKSNAVPLSLTCARCGEVIGYVTPTGKVIEGRQVGAIVKLDPDVHRVSKGTVLKFYCKRCYDETLCSVNKSPETE